MVTILYNSEAKKEAVNQWNNDPCGYLCAEGLEEGTREFYERIDIDRYSDYAPWLKGVIGFDKHKDKKLLEVGFGMGTDLFQFAKGGSIVHGVDLVPRHYEIAKKRFDLYGVEADLQLADAENLPFDDNIFDVVYTFGVIHHTSDTEKTISEIHRVLRPGGQAIIGVYHKNSAFYWLRTMYYNHILSGNYKKQSFNKTFSAIEFRGENNDAIPLVKAYSRHTFKKMLGSFSKRKLSVYHISRWDFVPFERYARPWIASRLEHILGWYLIAKCEK